MKKVSAAKFSNSLNNVANNLNNNVRRVVKNEMAINLIRVLIILYTSFVVPVLDANTLAMLNNNVVRLVVCCLIVYLSFMDVITAVLLTVAFVLTIHQGNKKTSRNNANNTVKDIDVNAEESELVNKINNISDVKVENYEDLNNALNNSPSGSVQGLDEEANQFQTVDNTPLEPPQEEVKVETPVENVENMPQGLDTSAEAQHAEFNGTPTQENNAPIRELPLNELNLRHPASSTMTDNLLAVGAELDENGPKGLTTAQNLYDASENAVPGADIMNQVLTVDNGLSAQGMGKVLGYNYSRHDGHHYTDGDGLVHKGLRNNAV